MYRLSDKQIDYILDDIRARGVEMEDLQQNLLDHICCLIEQNLEENGDFERFYRQTIRTFYKDALWEIEKETIALLTFKNYYVMKKMMILSGAFSALLIITGTFFKFMFWPGVILLLPLGILTGTLVFIPLVVTLKAREQQGRRDRFVMITGALAAILMCLSFLFKIMHWPNGLNMLYISAVITLVIFLPVYFFGGIRNPATKVNTAVTTILVILGYGSLFSLVRAPRSQQLADVVYTHDFVRNERILQIARKQSGNTHINNTPAAYVITGKSINNLCEVLKSRIIKAETGNETIGEDFENKKITLGDHTVNTSSSVMQQLLELEGLLKRYNSELPVSLNKIPVMRSFPQKTPGGRSIFDSYNVILILNEIVHIQMFVLQNEHELLAKS